MSNPIAINPQEAPEGFYAVLKSSLQQDQGNLCRQCDWRDQCCTPAMDIRNPAHRCMGYEVVLNDGAIVCREDRCSVAFKKIGSVER